VKVFVFSFFELEKRDSQMEAFQELARMPKIH